MAEPELPDSLSGDRVRLRELRRDDVAAWVSAFAEDPQLGVMIGAERDPSARDVRDRLKRRRRRSAQGRAGEYVIADPAEDALLGAVSLFALDWHSRRGELGIWLRRAARGQGLGTATLELIVAMAFDHLGLERLEMTTVADNPALPPLAARLGFHREGVLRRRSVERGRRVDIVFYGLLRSEWTGPSSG